MFEHLDDPHPPVASDALGAVTRRMARLRRARLARSLVGAASAALFVAGAVGASQLGDEPVVRVPTGGYDVPSPDTTFGPPPVGVVGHRANRLSTTGPLDGWMLHVAPVPIAGEPAFLRLGVRDPNGPVPRPVSVDFGDETKVQPTLPPCPPPKAVPEGDRTGEHVYLSFERDASGRPSFWNHTYAEPGTYVVTVVFEPGCGSRSRERSTARLELTVNKTR